jgi:V/A-type H+-transporting ATPase subunit E
MNGIENISEKILADAREKAAQLLTEAQEEAGEIRVQGEKNAAQEAASLQSALKTRMAQDAEKARMAQDLAQRMRLQVEKQSLVTEVFERALDTLLHMPEDPYRDLLCSLAVRAAGDGLGGELMLNKTDRERYGKTVVEEANKKLSQPLVLSDDTAPIVGGVVIRRGQIEINSALDVIVRMLSEQNAFAVSGILFGQGSE